MLIKNKGIKTNNFYIPPFELNTGEFIVLCLHNGQHFQETKIELKNIFSGKTKDKNIVINKNLTCVENYKESAFRRFFYSQTVGEYLEKNANSGSLYAGKIYEIEGICKKTKVKTLPVAPQRLLCLYATLSNTDAVIIDIQGQGIYEAKETYNIMNDFVKNGGSVILLEGYDDLKNDCTKYIEIQWNK